MTFVNRTCLSVHWLQQHVYVDSYCPLSPLLTPSQTRRTAGPTEPPPAKTPGAPRVGATDASGATGRTAEASAAAEGFCSAEARRRRGPVCCPPMEPNPNRRGRKREHAAGSLTFTGRKTSVTSPLSISVSHQLLLFFLVNEGAKVQPPPVTLLFPSRDSTTFWILKGEPSVKESPF